MGRAGDLQLSCCLYNGELKIAFLEKLFAYLHSPRACIMPGVKSIVKDTITFYCHKHFLYDFFEILRIFKGKLVHFTFLSSQTYF